VWFDGQFIFLLYPTFILQGYDILLGWLAVRIHAEATVWTLVLSWDEFDLGGIIPGIL
jgi:hypothetical protein